jgi:YfiH family protein
MPDQTDLLPVAEPPFRWSQAAWGAVLLCDALSPYAHHFFSTRGIDVRGPESGPGWDEVAAALGVDVSRVWRVHQVHGIDVTVADCSPAGHDAWPEGDLLVTERDDAALAIRTADCVPILLVDPVRRVVAAVHAGWRGTALGAAWHMVSLLQDRYGVDPASLVAAIGPSIGPDRYEVGPEVPAHFARRFDTGNVERWARPARGDRFLLDLWQANADQLEWAGVPHDAVHVARLCTATHPEVFHSYRVDGPRAGRMVAGIRLR